MMTSALLMAMCIAALAGCSVSAPQGLDAPPSHDSLASECPGDARYASIGTPDAPLAALQTQAQAHLAALHLQAGWDVPQAAPFADTPADRERLRRLLGTVLPALERHPARLFERLRVTHIALVKNLRVAGQRRLAMPTPETDRLVYADNGDVVCPAGMELRVHHELYHLIEHRLFGDFYYRDPQWLALNPPGLAYGQGGATAYGGQFQNLGHPDAGLVSRYAAYGPEEDKAEVFGWMMTPGYAARLRHWASADLALDAKRRFMQAVLAAQGGAAMDDNDFAARSQAPPHASD
jgi:hypothetical protein